MLKLKNVSKFYYQNGMIATGFSKINLELDMGEFVVITGESGSGKSTLLNVLSGLDKYEEGEMYINGEETSHYDEKDFEEYRRKYVGNIFQNFNLVNSYTVYQNVELSLLLNGEKKRDVKAKILDIIEKVGLTKYRNTKCSRLSGGQKQRVAIARALAKETPIIVADEPTGNLDSKSAKEVIELLREIAKDKLVIIVTHNIEQVEDYATRLIKMYDGKIVEDKYVSHPNENVETKEKKYKDIGFGNQIRIGLRNAFNVPAKFILVFIVFLFVALSISSIYSSLAKEEYDGSILGMNYYFNDTSDKRIIIKKADGTAFTEEDFAKVGKLKNIASLEECDPFIDNELYLDGRTSNLYIYGKGRNVSEITKVDEGRLPNKDGEIVIVTPNEWLTAGDVLEMQVLLNSRNYYYYTATETERDLKFTIVGISHSDDIDETQVYFTGNDLKKCKQNLIQSYNTFTFTFGGNTYTDKQEVIVLPNSKVKKGECIIPQIYGETVFKGEKATYKTTGLYENREIELKISNEYTEKNSEELLGIKHDSKKESGSMMIYMNDEEFYEFREMGYFQASVYIENPRLLDDTNAELEKMGFTTLVMRDALYDIVEELRAIVTLLKSGALLLVTIALFFITYLVVKLVMKSRNAYFTTIRTLGATRKVSKHILDIELMAIATIADLVFMGLIVSIKMKLLKWEYLISLESYLSTGDYIVVFFAMLVIALLIGNRFSRKLFKDSVMANYREVI